MIYNALTYPPIWVEAENPDQAAMLVIGILQDENIIFQNSFGGDPLTDAFSTDDGCYHIEFVGGYTGKA